MADQGSEGLLSPWLRKQRFKAAMPYLKGRILDFGCGSGTLAALIDAEHYLGVELDETSLQQARSHFPGHRFVAGIPDSAEKFDSIISLAVIEHVSDPSLFLASLAAHLDSSASSCIVVTTPHPTVDWVHDVGAAVGLFSKHANEEHEDLLDRAKLEMAGKQAGLRLDSYRRFLFGANQIAAFKKNHQ